MTTPRLARLARPAAVIGCAALLALAGCGKDTSAGSPADHPLVGLITKTDSNPYFQALKAGAQQEGSALGVDVKSYTGTSDDDTASQITAIEELVTSGAKGILITPAGAAVLPAISAARQAGLLVVALDSPTDPIDAVDATFATDNFSAGLAIGQWARAQVDPGAARIAMLDLTPEHVPVDVARDQGFLAGFGVALVDSKVIGDEKDARIVGHADTSGTEDGGKAAMTTLLAKDPSINVVYTINEPAAAGAHAVLAAAGRAGKVTIVSVDGGCGGVANVKKGLIGATAMQFPLRMARLGIDAVIDHALTGDVPLASPGLEFFNTGSQLVSDKPVDGLYTKDTAWGAENCWG